MSDDIALRIEYLGKRYRLGQTIDWSRTFREALMDLPTLLSQKAKRAASWLARSTSNAVAIDNGFNGKDKAFDIETPPGTFWALYDINLEIKQGEVLGIIGSNGAGKSTLLKILSRVTSPTKGHVELRGRVGSLLEVGTGFHPELTGRENIYLNGAILGMRKIEIDKKFDEITEFSGVTKFIDTPVKRYSSGMYVRLAFGVAAHLEPEILLIDEVLAVGDVGFQKKCLGKMQNVARQGRTVLFVSHNMGAIRQLCTACVWIDEGRIKEYGAPPLVIDSYFKSGEKSKQAAEVVFDENPQKQFQLRSARLMSDEGIVSQNFDCDKPINIELECQVHQRVPGLYGYLSVSRRDGTTVLVSDSFDAPPNHLDNLPVGMHLIRITVPARTLGPGDYEVLVNFTSKFSARNFNVDSPGVICSFSIDDFTSNRGNRRGGYFSTLLSWDVHQMSRLSVDS